MKNTMYVVLASAIALVGCRDEEFVGNPICPSSNFTFTKNLTVDNNSVDFGAAPLNISSDFSEEAEWNMKITGQTTGAVKKYSGKSSSVDINWYGNANDGGFFKQEEVLVELDVTCITNQSENVSVNAPTFAGFEDGFLISDYDGNGSFTNVPNPWGTDADKTVTATIETTDGSPQGGNYFHINGVSTNTDTRWYFGGYQVNIALPINNLSTHDPEKVFINVLCKSELPNSGIEFIFGTNGDNYAISKSVDWNEWQMLSIPLSEIRSTNDAKFLQNVDDIINLSTSLISSPEAATTAEIDIDFILITTNNPYNDL